MASVIVVGAGAGGLFGAGYLRRAGHDVVLLEAQPHIGGSASRFSMGGYGFLAGATTLVGLEADMPLGIVMAELGLHHRATPRAPAMTLWARGAPLTLATNDTETNAQRIGEQFGPTLGQYWPSAIEEARRAWRTIVALRYPPRGLGDLVRLAGSRHAWRSLPGAIATAEAALGAHGEFSAFERALLDELLVISTQSHADQTPALFGAIGLEYLQRPMWIAPGGLGGFLDDVADQLRERGVDLRTRRRALGVARTTHGYRVQTDDGPLDAEAVVLNLTHWDAARLCEGALADAFGRELRWHDKAWSAACLYVAVDDVLDRGRTPYHQIVLDRPLPVSGARSIFATLSTPGDALFAPEGQRTITASIHLDPARFAALEGERLAEEKRALEAEMYQALVAHFPELATTSPRLVRLATPSTWQSFAGRWQGRVGGLPWNHRTLLLGYPTGRTRTATLARVGDTVFPGQSVVAVAWGARRVASQLLEA